MSPLEKSTKTVLNRSCGFTSADDAIRTCHMCGVQIVPRRANGLWYAQVCQCEQNYLKQTKQTGIAGLTQIGDELSQGQRFTHRQSQQKATRTCPICHATVLPKEKNGQWLSQQCLCETKAEEEKEKLESKKRNIERLQRLSYQWLGSQYDDSSLVLNTFENFDKTREPKAFQKVKTFSNDLRGNLILYGKWGTGKTHLLTALCNELHQSGIETRFISIVSLFDIIDARRLSQRSHEDILQKLRTAPFIVLDDADKVPGTETRWRIYYSILNHRSNNKLPTGLSSNCEEELVKFVGPANVDRLKIGQVPIEMVQQQSYRELLQL